MVDRATVLDFMATDSHAPYLYRRMAAQAVSGQVLDFLDEQLPRVLAEGRALLLSGSVGNGKTFGLWYATAWLGVQRMPFMNEPFFAPCGHVYDFRDLPKLRIDDHAHFMDLCNRLTPTGYDEVGGEGPSGWNVETFDILINQRYQSELATLLTTNLTGAEFAGHYGQRVMDRLAPWCTVVEITDGSFRQAQARAAEHAAKEMR